MSEEEDTIARQCNEEEEKNCIGPNTAEEDAIEETSATIPTQEEKAELTEEEENYEQETQIPVDHDVIRYAHVQDLLVENPARARPFLKHFKKKEIHDLFTYAIKARPRNLHQFLELAKENEVIFDDLQLQWIPAYLYYQFYLEGLLPLPPRNVQPPLCLYFGIEHELFYHYTFQSAISQFTSYQIQDLMNNDFEEYKKLRDKMFIHPFEKALIDDDPDELNEVIHSADFDIKNFINGRSPMQVAAMYGAVRCFKLILDMVKPLQKASCQLINAAYDGGNREIIDLVHEQQEKMTNLETEICIYNHRKEDFKELIKNAVVSEELVEVALATQSVSLFITIPGAKFKHSTLIKYGFTNWYLFKALISSGVDVNELSPACVTPLIYSMRFSSKYTRYLLEHGADVDKAANGKTAKDYAVFGSRRYQLLNSYSDKHPISDAQFQDLQKIDADYSEKREAAISLIQFDLYFE